VNEPITSVLDKLGETLTFPTFTQKAVPGFSLEALNGMGTSTYDVSARRYCFQTSSLDVITNGIAEGNIFTVTLFRHRYTFSVERIEEDLTGWTNLHCNLETKEIV
jgi:hypothetical protein